MNFNNSEFLLLVVAFLVGYFFKEMMKGCQVMEGLDDPVCNKPCDKSYSQPVDPCNRDAPPGKVRGKCMAADCERPSSGGYVCECYDGWTGKNNDCATPPDPDPCSFKNKDGKDEKIVNPCGNKKCTPQGNYYHCNPCLVNNGKGKYVNPCGKQKCTPDGDDYKCNVCDPNPCQLPPWNVDWRRGETSGECIPTPTIKWKQEFTCPDIS